MDNTTNKLEDLKKKPKKRFHLECEPSEDGKGWYCELKDPEATPKESPDDSDEEAKEDTDLEDCLVESDEVEGSDSKEGDVSSEGKGDTVATNDAG